VVQPRVGGAGSSTRLPRFVNFVGATLLWAMVLAHAVGLSQVGMSSGRSSQRWHCWRRPPGCDGREMCRLLARVHEIRAGEDRAIDLGDLGVQAGGVAIVQFTYALCSDCRDLGERLARVSR